MHRHIASSAKKRRAQLKRKRAIKRGDTSPPDAPVHDRSRRKPYVKPNSSQVHPENVELVASARRLQSHFIKLSQEFLDHTRDVAIGLPLERPITLKTAILQDSEAASIQTKDSTDTSTSDGAILESTSTDSDRVKVATPLACPQRPKWRYDMTKEMVAKNEEEQFHKWLDQTDEAVDTWFETQDAHGEQNEVMPHAPTTFERNIEVWRQLWRVTEISQILLILLDSRCPLLHYPPSLATYFSDRYTARRTRIILVLTKVDIAGPVRAEAWSQFLKKKYPDLRIIQVESYLTRDSGSKKIYEPHLTMAFRQTLVEALKETHAEFLEPPQNIKDDPEKLAKWKPKVKKTVDWEAVLNASGDHVGADVEGVAAPKVVDSLPRGEGEDDDEQEMPEPEVLTIGLIGQPNVGKSSLLNALFGTTKVRASQTPGKTKHFQTLFWTSEVRLVDCPGLVFPNYTPMEAQVLSGILPISRVSAVSLCIYHASQLLPLEKIFELEHPRANEVPEILTREDKRTWRGERGKEREREEREAREKEEWRRKQWTAIDILVAFALKKGWVTAQAGRPDTHRAGNYILRAFAESRIRWGFWPPDTDLSLVSEHQEDQGNGIWIHSVDGSYNWDLEKDHEDVDDRHDIPGHASESEDDEDFLTDSEEGEEDDNEAENPSVAATSGKFGALLLNDDLESSEVEKDEE